MINLPDQIRTKIVDTNSRFFGVPEEKLMTRAGQQTLGVLKKSFRLETWRIKPKQKKKKVKKVQIFCGTGGNGGDGFALAYELLKINIPVEVILAKAPENIRSKAAYSHFAKLPLRIIKIFSEETVLNGDLLIDAMLGVGATGVLQKPYADLARRINQTKARVVSLYLPTPGLKSDLIISYHFKKKTRSQARQVVVDIGVPQAAEETIGPGDFLYNFPKRRVTSHKGHYGLYGR